MTKLIMVRHGETEWNAQGRIQGQTDVPLNERGQTQAQLLGERLTGVEFDVVYASTLKRAALTAEIALNGSAEIRPAPHLREIGFGEYEGFTSAELRARDPDAYKNWFEDDGYAPNGGETIGEFAERITQLTAYLRETHSEETVLLVGHGGSLSMLACLAIGLDKSRRWQFKLSNASLSIMSIYDRGAFLELWNDTHHLNGLVD